MQLEPRQQYNFVQLCIFGPESGPMHEQFRALLVDSISDEQMVLTVITDDSKKEMKTKSR